MAQERELLSTVEEECTSCVEKEPYNSIVEATMLVLYFL